nr:type II toxin-antitoxin system RelB/DinJ family antitoxin [uncultured Acetatifactor sp.]
MAQTSVNFRMDAELKESVEEICRKMGMNLTTAITIFCTKVAQERRIPFEITADPAPFYSESNIRYLEKKMQDYKAGRLKLAEHELIEEQGLKKRNNGE